MLEGGGMRSAYTAGVLDFFLDEEFEFPVVATASSGALIGSSYIAKQRTRNYQILQAVGNNSKSVSVINWLRNREIFNMDYIFDQIPRDIIPLNYQSFTQSPSTFIIGTTDIQTGKPLYFNRYETIDDLLTITRASCSLPVLAPSVRYQGKELLDGGISNPIPIHPLITQGIKKHIVVLTRNRGYIKKATKLNWFFQRLFKNNPELVRILRDRHILYNQTMHLLYEMEKRNEVFILQPERPLRAARIEKNKEKLEELYNQGYEETKAKKEILLAFLESQTQDKTSTIPS
ncbi:patatin-like phospholipase family protein [Oceanobacillus senegalensis]|uniref:patatin-like phospholipase family protein n=1 Tax=Oceanobacillus senegalensis TaxID=1936063 RepID=UPI002481B3C8|nr:patatin family protein [Oceanobacillus senegalensis]